MKRVSLVIVCLSMVLYSISGRAVSMRAQTKATRLTAKEAEQTIARRARQAILALKFAQSEQAFRNGSSRKRLYAFRLIIL